MGAGVAEWRRQDGWRGRLFAMIEERRRRPYEAGTQDCGLFAADAVEAITGRDPASEFRGRYRTIEEGFAALRSAGYADHVEFAASLFPELVAPFVAENAIVVGDLAVVEGEGGPSVGVVTGDVIQVVAADGIGVVPLRRAVRAFRIG